MKIQQYDFVVRYKPGKEQIADTFSRLCENPESPPFDPETEEYILTVVGQGPVPAVTIRQIEEESGRDPIIKAIRRALDNGDWPHELLRYKIHATEYLFVGDLLLRGLRIVVPETLQPRMLDLAHENHMGATEAKMLLRTRIWWPSMEKDIEKKVNNCKECKLVSITPPAQPMHRHKMPIKPWHEIGADLMGPTPSGHYLLVLEDYYSHFPIVKILKSTRAVDVLDSFREVFAERGNPHMVRMDNGPQFNCQEVREFLENEGIRPDFTVPYCPRENGLVERMNRVLKKPIIISHNTNPHRWVRDLHEFLKSYRSTPHITTGVSPAELLNKSQMRTKIPAVQDFNKERFDAEIRDTDEMQKEIGRKYSERRQGKSTADVQVGDIVYRKRLTPHTKWETPFVDQELEVIGKDGSDVQTRSYDGV